MNQNNRDNSYNTTRGRMNSTNNRNSRSIGSVNRSQRAARFSKFNLNPVSHFSNFKIDIDKLRDKIEEDEINTPMSERVYNKEKSINLGMLYLPEEAIEETERSKHSFRGFDTLDGNREFIKRAEQDMPSDSLKGLKERLKINKKMSKSYMTFYKKKHKKIFSMAMQEINNWEKRGKKMPKIKVLNRGVITMPNLKGDRFGDIVKRMNTMKKPKDIELTEEERKSHINTLSAFWLNTDPYFPLESREGATFTQIGAKGWLIGGVNQKMIKKIHTLNLDTLEFVEVVLRDFNVTIPRFNHSAEAYGKKIVIFGGEKFTNSTFYSRVCLNDIKIFDTGK